MQLVRQIVDKKQTDPNQMQGLQPNHTNLRIIILEFPQKYHNP